MKIYDILFGPRQKSISKIIEEGNHNELIEKRGEYYDLVSIM